MAVLALYPPAFSAPPRRIVGAGLHSNHGHRVGPRTRLSLCRKKYRALKFLPWRVKSISNKFTPVQYPSDLLPIFSDVPINVSTRLLAYRISTSKGVPLFPRAILLLLLLIKPCLLLQRPLPVLGSMNQSRVLLSDLAIRVIASPFNRIIFELTDFEKLVLAVESMARVVLPVPKNYSCWTAVRK